MSAATRVAQLQDTLRRRGMVGAILGHSRDVYYYAGTAQPAFLVIRPDDATLFVRRGFHLACEETDLPPERIVSEKSLRAVCQQMFPGAGTGETVGTELDVTSVLQAQELQQALGARELADISPDVLSQRMIKDAAEIASIRKACEAVQAGHLAAVSSLRPGMTELEFGAAIEHAERVAGHEGIAFMRMADFPMSQGPLASGPNLRRTTGVVYTITGVGLSPAVPGGPSRRVMEKGDVVVVDIPACIDGYHSDQSRTYAVGAAPPRALELFDRLRDVADHLIASLRPGVTTGEGFDLAVARAHEVGIGDSFRAFEHQPPATFVAHGVGLELNEPPVLVPGGDVSLQAGMVLAVEMHVMEPRGVTVKLEDTVHLTESGAEILTLSPRELIVVES